MRSASFFLIQYSVIDKMLNLRRCIFMLSDLVFVLSRDELLHFYDIKPFSSMRELQAQNASSVTEVIIAVCNSDKIHLTFG